MPRRAFTLVEALVAIAIIGILLAILVPAVQSAREAARATQCRSNMHQLGIALHSYHDVYGMFPRHGTGGKSFHVAILPYIDQRALFEQFPDRLTMEPHNRLMQYGVALYQCPSDPYSNLRANSGDGFATSYPGNWGTGYQVFGANGFFGRRVSSRDVADGLTQTAAISEWLVGAEHRPDRRRPVYRTPYELIGPDQLEHFMHLCRQTANELDPRAAHHKGFPWVDSSGTLYNHVLYPNDVSCSNESKARQGAYSASSEHPGGVHVLFADGRIGFVPTQVDLTVWRAIGSRAGGEVVSISF